MDTREHSRTTAEPREYDIVVDSLTKHYGQVVALDDLSFRVPRGEFFGFLGLNGAGKTTTIKVLSGLLKGDYTRIEVAGHDLAREPLKVKASIGVMLEEPSLYEQLTGLEFLEFVGAMHGLDGNTLRRRVTGMVEEVAMTEDIGKMIADFSKGMRHRIALAAALIHEPQVLLLDEPFAGIDALGVHRFKEMLHEWVAEGRTILFSSHVMEVVEGLCTSFAVIHHGRVVSTNTMEGLQRDHPGKSLEDYFIELTREDCA